MLKVEDTRKRSEFFYDIEVVICRRQKEGEPQLVVPSSLVKAAISLNHYPKYAGRQHTLDIITIYYWWPNIQKNLERYVDECDKCQRKKLGHEFRAPLGEIREAHRPFQVCHMEAVGPYPRTARGNRYILIFIDYLTKYMEAIPVEDLSALTCACAYATRIVPHHGVSEYLVTNRGSNFTSMFFNETYKILA
jgi:hypothetical protein